MAAPTKRRPGGAKPPATDDDDDDDYIPGVASASFCYSSEAGLPTEDELGADLRVETAGVLADRIVEHMALVEHVSARSKHLKGSFVRQLRVAARTARVAAKELASRTAPVVDDVALAQENGLLRAKVKVLSREIARLTEDRAQRTSPPPTSPEKKKTPRASPAPNPGPPSPRTTRRRVAEEEPDGQEAFLRKIAQQMDRRFAALRRELLGPGRDRQAPDSVYPRGGKPPPEKKRPPRPAGYDTESPRGGKPPLEKKKRPGPPRPAASARDTGHPRGGKPPLQKKRPPTSAVSGTDTDYPRGGKPPPERKRPPPGPDHDTWARVVGRRERRAAVRRRPAEAATAAAVTPGTSKGGRTRGAAPTRRMNALSRPPRTAAVAVTADPGSKVSYAQAIATARSKIDLAELGIAGVRPRRAVNGGLLLEVSGPDGPAKASSLASAMAKALEGSGVRIAQPVKTAELRIRGLDDSVRPEEVAAALAKEGGCAADEVRVGTIRTSPPSGLGSVWLRCPLAAARKVAGAGRLLVGWSSARVEVLGARPLQCYRCLETGHVRQRCTSAVDRGGLCYRCGAADHRASLCTAQPRCPLCADLGRPSAHRLGAKTCAPPPPKRRRGKGGTAGAATRTEEAGAVAAPEEREEAAAPVERTDAPVDPELGLEEAMVLG